MNFEEALKLIDAQVFANIGRHLSEVEKIVLEAAWEDRAYEQVAKNSDYEFNYLRGQVAPKLWMLLSPIIGKKVTKKRLRSILEQRVAAPNSQLPGQLDIQQSITPPPQLQVIGGQPPNVSSFNGRTAELAELGELIVNNRCVVLYGAAGIGKSALAAKLIEDLQCCPTHREILIQHNCCAVQSIQLKERLRHEPGFRNPGDNAQSVPMSLEKRSDFTVEPQPGFDCLIWKSVHYGPSLQGLLTDLLKLLALPEAPEQEPESIQDKTSALIECLQKSRCLLVLDAAEAWLQGDRNKSFNPYGDQYAEYGIFFRRIMEEKHRSCIVLTSREPFKDLMKLQRSGRPSYSFKIAGLDLKAAKKVLQAKGLADEHRWEELLEPYLGNPAVIELVASRVESFFAGSVAKFLNYKTVLVSEIFRETLAQQCQPGRLTHLEKQILLYLVEKIIDDPGDSPGTIAFSQLSAELQAKTKNTISFSALIEAVEALNDRSLILVSKDKETKELLFKLPTLVEKYVLKEKGIELLDADHQEDRVRLLNAAHRLFNPPEHSGNFAV